MKKGPKCIYLSDETYKLFKILSIKKGISISEYIEKLIEKELEKNN